ncbi:MAG: GNAT family N-acetyltransferase [Clostridia bacterium]|nr:GNAT family N-acetyltransferase [Clostridia bacterium]
MIPKIIPQPKKAVIKEGKLTPGKTVSDERFGAAATAYEQYKNELGYEPGDAAVYLKYADNIKKEAYSIRCGEGRIDIYASDLAGANNALSVLLQLAAESGGEIEATDIDDEPDCEYRGIMIDIARIWHPLEYLLKYVDLCRYYRFSYLHLHFSDTQSYTLPCKDFPNLTAKDRHYTYEQIKQLNEYAYERGVKIMPEIDVPGHCTPFLQSYPEIFGHGEIIGYHKEVFDAFEKILGELCEMFPYSDRIHVGGDEADIKQWLQCEKCLSYAKENGIPADEDERLSAERILASFVAKLSEIILKHGKTPVVWEGFCKEVNYLVPKTTEVFSWENYYQTTPELIEAGYTVINGSWCPNYVVEPAVMWSVKDCFDWDIFTFRPVHPQSPYINSTLKVPPYEKMIGGQLLSWGDFGARSNQPQRHLIGEFEKVAERAAATAENTWNKEKNVTYEEFIKAHEVQNKAVCRLFNYKYIKTKRFILRPFKKSDIEDAKAYCQSLVDEEFEEFDPELSGSFVDKCIQYTQKAQPDNYCFAIELDGIVIGGCNIDIIDEYTGNVGWYVHKAHQNKGYATEAGKEMLKFGFEYLGLHRIEAHCHINNVRSYKVMEKLHMRREGLNKKDHKYKGGVWGDSYCYAILEEEYKNER